MLFRLSDVFKSYGVQDVLRGATLQINPGEHVGLVGRNGAGKSTIFRLVRGEESADRGEVVKARGVRLGLLDQHIHFDAGSTVHESALAAFGHLQHIEHQMHELEHVMSEPDSDLEKVLERYSDLQHQFEHEGGFEYTAKAEAILLGLGFDKETWSMETSKLSGGQQNRLGLARLLLAAPDVLLLDEPTNHLDVRAVEWLEEFLQSYQSAYVIVSHDRYFLDQSCRRIIELENGKAASYSGNYSSFLIEREERREAQQRAYDNQQQLIAKTQEFIRRNIAGQKTKQAKSRRKMLEKLERVDAVRHDQSSGDFRLQAIERTGNHVLTVTDLTVGYPDKLLAGTISFILRRGECLGIIGPNGSGKTTFLRTILNKVAPLSGEVRWGTKVQIGYYAQQLDDLDDRNEIIMELRRVAPASATAGELRSFLAKFLFTGDDVYKHVQDLSGGEKGRLALAKLIYSRVNVLVLDEPTNHLDIPSREALEEALSAYEGTIITISHDRYFLDRVATQILALDGEGKAEHYDGDYTEYHDWKLGGSQRDSASGSDHQNLVSLTPENVAAETFTAEVPPKKVVVAPQKKAGVKVVKKKRVELRTADMVEADIAKAEQLLARISEQMGTPEVARDAERLKTLKNEYQQTETRLRVLYEEWDRVNEHEEPANV
ncbi:MAG TPA: ABC-F family ATP-binding cassette domain-containing protein [Pyrinomonadaceae bacterium]|jgi:ATPase components of ABC transporters with duplicated ATPase domains|nr:ABC-F family ATP-binding cassette domain-containing protein [Pyrinomonadaceae bacterium]